MSGLGRVCVVALLLCTLSSQCASMQLEMIQLVFRHGDRSSIDSFPSNQCDESCWPQGYGQLTQRGMRQHYAFGQYLNATYRETGLLNSSFYIQKQIHIRSTDVDRTLMSVQAQMSALYQPRSFQVFEEGLPWQPLPVHTVPKHNDSLLRGYDTFYNICPRYTQILKDQEKQPYYLEMQNKHQDFLVWLSKETNTTVTLMNIYKVFDPIFCQAQHDKPQPAWLNESVFTQMQELADFGMMALFHGKEAQKLTAGLLVGELRDNMLTKTKSPSNPDKAYFYSAHDTTVAALLNALELSNGLQPPYASAVILELYSDAGNHFFKVVYRNDSSNTTYSGEEEPVDLTPNFTGCQGKSPCPFSAFQEFAETVVPKDYLKECGVQSGSSSLSKETKTVIIAGFSIGGLLIIVLMVVVIVLCRRRLKSDYHLIGSESSS